MSSMDVEENQIKSNCISNLRQFHFFILPSPLSDTILRRRQFTSFPKRKVEEFLIGFVGNFLERKGQPIEKNVWFVRVMIEF